MIQGTVWIVDDDSSIRWVLERALRHTPLKVKSFESAADLVQALKHEQPDAIVSDIRMPGMDGLALLHHIQSLNPLLPVIIMTAHSDLDAAVNAYQQGAFEYLPKPFDIDEALLLIERAITHYQESQANIVPSSSIDGFKQDILIGEAPAMQEVYRIIGRLSRSSMSVLINGESGTGKERVAQALHQHSPRKNAPFIALNMAAIPKELIESELFGHEKGAFTGATQIRPGRFEQANLGTLFLDEIGDMPLDVQTRLLRVLAEGQFYRVGGLTPIKVDVRIIAATHQNLESLVKESRFREDLFHRLNVIRIHLPPLRERKEDIPRLAEHFLYLVANELGMEPKVLHPETIKVLQQQPWTGNVRELENLCRWLMVMSLSQEILVRDLPSTLSLAQKSLLLENEQPLPTWEALFVAELSKKLQAGEYDLALSSVSTLEHLLIETALRYTQGHKQETAKLLGWGRNTLARKIKELGIEAISDDE